MARTGPVLTQKKRLNETLKIIFNTNQFKQPNSKHFLWGDSFFSKQTDS